MIGVGNNLLGRVVDGFGNPMDGKGDIKYEAYRHVYREPPNPLERQRINKPLQTGVRSIDGYLPPEKGSEWAYLREAA
jgi:flagellum-specific ATP synthase